MNPKRGKKEWEDPTPKRQKKETERQRRWEDMQKDCLINIFGRLDLDDMTIGIPLTCKSWYNASLSPQCWRILDFDTLQTRVMYHSFAQRFEQAYIHHLETQFSLPGFLRLVVSRSHGCVERIIFSYSSSFSWEDFVYISRECPMLKVLALPKLNGKNLDLWELVGNWKGLEWLHMQKNHIDVATFNRIVLQISKNSKNLIGLQASVDQINKESADLLITLENLRHLHLGDIDLGHVGVRKPSVEAMRMVLTGCKELVELYLEMTGNAKKVVSEFYDSKPFDSNCEYRRLSRCNGPCMKLRYGKWCMDIYSFIDELNVCQLDAYQYFQLKFSRGDPSSCELYREILRDYSSLFYFWYKPGDSDVLTR